MEETTHKRRIGTEARRIYTSYVAKEKVLPMITNNMRHRVKKALRTFKKTALEQGQVDARKAAAGKAVVKEEEEVSLVKKKVLDPTTAVLQQFDEAFFAVFTTLLRGTYQRFKATDAFHAWEAAHKAWARVLRGTERDCAARVVQRAWRERIEAQEWARRAAHAVGGGFGAARMLGIGSPGDGRGQGRTAITFARGWG
jgi:hypothetical protein